VRHVKVSEYEIPLGELTGGGAAAGVGLSGRTTAASETTVCAPGGSADSASDALFGEPMLVFCGMSPQEVSRFIDRLNASGAPRIALKAVMTATNRDWNSRALYEELCQERAYFAAQKKK